MLNFEKIKNHFPKELVSRNPRALVVEYLQYQLLDAIFQQAGSEKLSFMGGTAIRLVYGSERFSEDLDFDNFGLSFSSFQSLLKKANQVMANKGFEAEFRFVEKGAYHCYIKFPKLLYTSGLSVYQDEKILVRVDMVKKKKLAEPRVYVLSNFDVYRRILVNEPQVVLAQKMLAILERKRAKGRDFYDVSFLLSSVQPDYDFLKKTAGFNKADLRAKLLKKANSLDLAALSKDVQPLLFDDQHLDRILSFPDFIMQELK